jgi:hypothetical protein
VINTATATTVAELAELVGLIEQDTDLNVVVFDSANPDFYLAHHDVENDAGKTAALGVGPTGLAAWIDVLVRPALRTFAPVDQLAPGALGEGLHADRPELVVGGTELHARVDPTIRPAQPFRSGRRRRLNWRAPEVALNTTRRRRSNGKDRHQRQRLARRSHPRPRR